MKDNPDWETEPSSTGLWSVETLASLLEPRGDVSSSRIFSLQRVAND